eukprot:scaffold3436_cov32-Tisochrysis_lutea.AAC.4
MSRALALAFATTCLTQLTLCCRWSSVIEVRICIPSTIPVLGKFARVNRLAEASKLGRGRSSVRTACGHSPVEYAAPSLLATARGKRLGGRIGWVAKASSSALWCGLSISRGA